MMVFTQEQLNASSILELRKIGEISGTFYVPAYQRGYRWGRNEVTCLLSDIWENGARPYCLQPIVVKQTADAVYELIDGQQRLTTLYLILAYVKNHHLPSAEPLFELTYETRQSSREYLRTLEPDLRDENIDFFHMYGAYAAIEEWFASHKTRTPLVAVKLYEFLFEYVNVIWYQASPDLDGTALFTRLNAGRIPLDDAELVKALLLSRCQSKEGLDRTVELAAQWDRMEQDLRQPDLWAFITPQHREVLSTHISLFLNTLAKPPDGLTRPPFHTFFMFRNLLEKHSVLEVWGQVLDLHALVLGWFEDRDCYHKVGYLVATGHEFSDLVALAQGRAKSGLQAMLDERIRKSLDMNESDVMSLNYERDRKRCFRLLLLMNVETVRLKRSSFDRYPFRIHAAEEWSIEHIHAQQSEGLNRQEQWQEWLRLHRDALRRLPCLAVNHEDASERARIELIERIDQQLSDIDRAQFEELAREVTTHFAASTAEDSGQPDWIHSIENLALLPADTNSALGNSVFEVKRHKILNLDRDGVYLPPCTRNVFLKYYTGANVQQPYFWSRQDGESYRSAMLHPKSGVRRYLKEESQ